MNRQNSSSAKQSENGQADVVDGTQTYTHDLQRKTSQSDIIDSKHSFTTSSQEENVQEDPIDKTCSEPTERNEKDKQSNTVDRKPSHSACSPDNDNTNLMDKTLFSTDDSQQKYSQNDVSDNTNSGRVDEREEGHQNPHSVSCTHGDGDDSDITTSKQQDVNSPQGGNDQPDVFVNTQCCRANMQEQNDTSYTTDNKYHNVADPQEEKDQSDVFDTASLQDQSIILADKKMSNADRSQVNTKLDLFDNIHAEPSDTQEVMRRCSMGSDLSDTADEQGQKYSPSTQRENDRFDLLDDNQSCTAKSPDENDDGNITNSNLPETADLNDESDQSNVFGNNQSCTTNNVQEENDISSLTYRKLPNSAGSDQENDKSDLSDTMQLCTFNARDHHIDNQETAMQQHGEIGRQLPMGVQQLMLQMRPGHMDVNVNKATVIGNKNTIIQGNPEEHSETLNAISASTDQMTDEQEKQTTNLKQEIHGTERRLTRVIADEGSNITATVTNTGHETKERVHSMHESMERKQGDMEMQLAKMKQQNAVLLRDTEENTSYNVNKSTEAQKEAIEQSVSKTTVNIVKEIDKVKADVYDTEQKMLSAVNRQAELLQEEIVHMRQKLANDMKQSGDEITKCIHTAQDDTIAVIEHLKESMDSLRRNHAEEMAAFQQTFTNQMAELQRSMISSNKYHKKAIDKVSRQVCHLQKKIDCMDGNMEELALETTVTKVKNVLFDRVCKSVKSSEKRLLDAIYDYCLFATIDRTTYKSIFNVNIQ